MQQSSINKDKKHKIYIFLILNWLIFFFEVRAFTIVVLKHFSFSTSKAILSILPPHFTIHQPLNVLFFLPIYLK